MQGFFCKFYAKLPENSTFLLKIKAILSQKGQERGALNPNTVLCTDQALSPAFCALNPGSALNPRMLNPGTNVYQNIVGT